MRGWIGTHTTGGGVSDRTCIHPGHLLQNAQQRVEPRINSACVQIPYPRVVLPAVCRACRDG